MNRAEIEESLYFQAGDLDPARSDEAHLLLKVLPLIDTASQWQSLVIAFDGPRYGTASYEVRRYYRTTPTLRRLIAIKETP